MSVDDWNQDKREPHERSLFRWNVSMGVLHLVQGIAVLAGALTAANAKAFRIPITTNVPVWISTGTGPGAPSPAVQRRGEFPFAAVTSGFAFMSAAAHFIVLIFFQKYLADLRQGINVFRWYEYAFSSSLMIVLIAQLFGMWDAVSLALMASVNASMCLFGLLHERMNAGRNSKDVNWEPFWFGCFAGAVPWACIFTYLGASPSVNQVPGFVWGILAAYLFFFNTFPINMYLQYKQVGWFNDTYWGFRGGG